MHTASALYRKYLKNDYVRIMAGGFLVIILTLLSGSRDYNGSGMTVITAALAGTAAPAAFAVKMLMTAATAGAGFKGGEIIPAMFIGATFGCTAAPFLGLDPVLGAEICLVAFFCGVVNCPVSSLLLSVEFFGSGNFLLFGVASSVSYMLSGYYSLYSGQKFMNSKPDADADFPSGKMISFYRRGILMRKQLCRLPLTKIRTKAEIPQVSDFQIPAGFFALSSGRWRRPASAGTGVLSGSFRLTLKPAPERKSLSLLHRLHTELLLQRIDLALICLLRRIPSFCGHFIVNRILHAERFVQRAAECLVYVICRCFDCAVHIQIAYALFQQENVLHQIFIIHFIFLLKLQQSVEILENLLVFLGHLFETALQLSVLNLTDGLFALCLENTVL